MAARGRSTSHFGDDVHLTTDLSPAAAGDVVLRKPAGCGDGKRRRLDHRGRAGDRYGDGHQRTCRGDNQRPRADAANGNRDARRAERAAWSRAATGRSSLPCRRQVLRTAGTPVSIVPKTLADLPQGVPEGFGYAAAFQLNIGDDVLSVPVQLSIPVAPGTPVGTHVVFYRARSDDPTPAQARPYRSGGRAKTVWSAPRLAWPTPTSPPEHGSTRRACTSSSRRA